MRLLSAFAALLASFSITSANAQNNLGGTAAQASPQMQQAMNDGVLPIQPGIFAQALSSDPNVAVNTSKMSPDGKMAIITYTYGGLNFGLLFQGCEQVGCALMLMTNISKAPNVTGIDLSKINQINSNTTYGFFTVLTAQNILGYANAYTMMPKCDIECHAFNLGFFMGAAREAQGLIGHITANGNLVSRDQNLEMAAVDVFKIGNAYGTAFASSEASLPVLTWEKGSEPVALSGQEAFEGFTAIGMPAEMVSFLKFPSLLD